MKYISKYYSTILFVFICFELQAQKHDYNVLSRRTDVGQGMQMFYVDSLSDVRFKAITLNGLVAASPPISDKDGKLLGYFNGVRMLDSLDRMAINGDSLNMGNFFKKTFFQTEEDLTRGTYVGQNCVILPYLNDSTYIMFHMGFEFDVNTPDFELPAIYDHGFKLNSYSDGLYYSILRARSDHRIEFDFNFKNVKILDDFLRTGELFSCKHANGKDWWIIVPSIVSNKAYSILLTDEGIEIKQPFELSNFNNSISASAGAINCSPNGKKLARILHRMAGKLPDLVEIWDFDRCNGKVGNQYDYDTLALAEQYTVTTDIEFSPNNQFLYVATGQYIFQMDLDDTNFILNRDTIAAWDGFLYYGNIPMFDNLLTLPNNKIIVNSFVSTPYLHYIHEPNQKGSNCNFEQRALVMPKDAINIPLAINFESFPTFPPYRMEALDIDCTMAVDHIPDITLDVYPNPFRSQLFVSGFETLQGIISIEVFDLFGRLLHVESQDAYQGFKLLETALWDPGIYIVSVKSTDGERRVTRKVVKI
ncbi:MAG: T9SS type A sorting domain-containing protein [Saprospiraceae bacterium]